MKAVELIEMGLFLYIHGKLQKTDSD
jgi:hypothetical protein